MSTSIQQPGSAPAANAHVRAAGGRWAALKKRLSWQPIVLPIAALLVILGAWEYASETGIFNPIIVPSPSDTGRELWALLGKPYFWSAARITVLETLIGFGIGCAVGLVLGVLTATVRLFKLATYPWVVAFQNMPRVALAPLFLTWFGFGMGSKIALAATIAFVPVLLNTMVGLQSVSEDSRVLMRSLGASRRHVFLNLSLPTAAPAVMAGLKLATTLALLAAVIGEFIGASEGLGVLLKDLSFQLNIAGAFAVAVFMAIIGLAFYGLLAAIEAKAIYWRHE